MKKNEEIDIEQRLNNFKRKIADFEEEWNEHFISEKDLKLNLSEKSIDLSKKIKIKNNLLSFIRLSGYTRTEIAQKIGITTKTLNNIINGRFSTSLEVAFKLAKLFNIKVDDLFYIDLGVEDNEL